MGKADLKGFFHFLLIAATCLLAAITIIASYAGKVPPADSMIMPLLGLSLPILLVGNLIVSLTWGWSRKWWALIPLAAILWNWNYLSSIMQFHFNQEKKANAQYLKIATYNVHVFGNEFTAYSSKEIAQLMQQEQVDVICFQEFGSNYIPMDSIRNAFSHWQYAILPSDSSVHKTLPLAIFSRYPLINKRFISFPQSANASMVCDVIIHTDTIRVFNNHLQTTSVSQNRKKWELEMSAEEKRNEALQDAAETLHGNFVKRALQANIISSYVQQSPHPVLLCGDLNSLPSSYTYRHLSEVLKDGFKTTGRGYMYTYRYGKRLLRIDYIFHSPSLRGISYRSPDWDLCSDHNPVIMEIEIP